MSLVNQPVSMFTYWCSPLAVDLFGFPHPGSFGAVVVDQGTFPGGYGSSYANLPYLITPFEALQERARQVSSQVYGWFDNYNHTLQAQQAAVGEALNATCLVDVRQLCGEGYDRQNLSASWEGDATIEAVASECTRTVVLYSACGPFNASNFKSHPNITSVLNVGGLGQEAGHAIVDVLYGDHNPSAKLPYTIANQVGSRWVERTDPRLTITPLWLILTTPYPSTVVSR